MINKIANLIYKNNKKITTDFEFSRYTFDIELLNEIVNKFDFEKNVKIYVPNLPAFTYEHNDKQYTNTVFGQKVKPIKLSDGMEAMSDNIANHINKGINSIAKMNDMVIFAPYQMPFLCRLVPPDDRLGIIIRYGYIKINKDKIV